MKKLRTTKGVYFWAPKKGPYNKWVFTCRALSHKELLAIELLVQENRVTEASIRLLEIAILNIEALHIQNPSINDLPFDIISELAGFIRTISDVTEEEYNNLETSLRIHLDPTFQSETWNCTLCKQKKLDRVRNCGYLGEQDKNKDFKVFVGGHLYTHCPIYDLDTELLSDAILCYNMFDKGFLPDEGGFYDQTRFFVVSSQLVANYIAEQNKKELEKLKNK